MAMCSTRSGITAGTISSRSGTASAGIPLGILAHSTHVKGPGTYDAGRRVEAPRINVTLATGIPREQCEHLSLDYRRPGRCRS